MTHTHIDKFVNIAKNAATAPTNFMLDLQQHVPSLSTARSLGMPFAVTTKLQRRASSTAGSLPSLSSRIDDDKYAQRNH